MRGVSRRGGNHRPPPTCADCGSLLKNEYGELKCPQCGPVIIDNIRKEETDMVKNVEKEKKRKKLTFLGMTAIGSDKISKKIRRNTVDEKEKGRTRMGMPAAGREVERPSKPDSIEKAFKNLSEEGAEKILEKVAEPSVIVEDQPTCEKVERKLPPWQYVAVEPAFNTSWQNKKWKYSVLVIISIIILIGFIILFKTTCSSGG